MLQWVSLNRVTNNIIKYDQVEKSYLTLPYLICMNIHLLNIISEFLLLVSLCLKVITLSGLHSPAISHLEFFMFFAKALVTVLGLVISHFRRRIERLLVEDSRELLSRSFPFPICSFQIIPFPLQSG